MGSGDQIARPDIQMLPHKNQLLQGEKVTHPLLHDQSVHKIPHHIKNDEKLYDGEFYEQADNVARGSGLLNVRPFNLPVGNQSFKDM